VFLFFPAEGPKTLVTRPRLKTAIKRRRGDVEIASLGIDPGAFRGSRVWWFKTKNRRGIHISRGRCWEKAFLLNFSEMSAGTSG